MNYASLKVYKEKGPVCSEGTPLTEYNLFFKVPEGAEIEVRKGSKVVGHIKEGMWLGVIDAWARLE